MRRLIRFLSSVYFAALLIAAAALSAIIGTFIEAKTGSHLMAAKWTYSHPLFYLFLGLFFVNILFSALSRWPFQRHHIPFLLTHLGLLLIITGVALKNLFGLQGVMALKEGTGKDKIILPGTEALVVTPPKGDLHVEWLHRFPHHEQIWSSWIDHDKLHILGLPPLPFGKTTSLYAARTWTLGALESINIEQTLAELEQKAPRPSFYVIRDANTTLHLLRLDQETTHETFDPHTLRQLVLYDKGRKGYTVPFELEKDLVVESPLKALYRPLPLPSKLEDARPLAVLRLTSSNKTEELPLGFDPYGTGLKWAAFNGEYLLQFRSKEETLPYRIRLKEAKQLYYPGTTQTYSYEAILWIKNKANNHEELVTLSMNHVHETADGFRFYLGNIVEKEGSSKEIQLIINHDPFKYKTTYPGGVLVALGSLLLLFPALIPLQLLQRMRR